MWVKRVAGGREERSWEQNRDRKVFPLKHAHAHTDLNSYLVPLMKTYSEGKDWKIQLESKLLTND